MAILSQTSLKVRRNCCRAAELNIAVPVPSHRGEFRVAISRNSASGRKQEHHQIAERIPLTHNSDHRSRPADTPNRITERVDNVGREKAEVTNSANYLCVGNSLWNEW